jgi:hypothetical protein
MAYIPAIWGFVLFKCFVSSFDIRASDFLILGHGSHFDTQIRVRAAFFS